MVIIFHIILCVVYWNLYFNAGWDVDTLASNSWYMLTLHHPLWVSPQQSTLEVKGNGRSGAFLSLVTVLSPAYYAMHILINS